MNLIRILIIASFLLVSCTGSDQAKKFNQKEKTMALDSTKQCFSFGWINRELISATDSSTMFASDIVTENYSGTLFNLRLEREVTFLSEKEIIKQITIDVKGLNYVASTYLGTESLTKRI